MGILYIGAREERACLMLSALKVLTALFALVPVHALPLAPSPSRPQPAVTTIVNLQQYEQCTSAVTAPTSTIAVVLFKSRACRACSAISPKYSAWASEVTQTTEKAAFYEVYIDTRDEFMQLARVLGIVSIPAGVVHSEGAHLPATVCAGMRFQQLQQQVHNLIY